ncbi:hypothetical protein [Paraburkholderia aromaticivorans]|uniref:hypothetical protein n=1 Tax=Paraburkholderia aromaticivorans TaxID=2026199 RepID=UPI0038BC6375
MRALPLCFLSIILALQSFSVWPAEPVTVESPPQTSIWFEQRVGHVVVAAHQRNGKAEAALSYGYYLAAIGPRPATASKDYGDCLRQAVKDAGTSFISSLSNEAGLFVPVVEPIYSEKQLTRTQNAIVTACGEYKNAIVTHCKSAGVTDPLITYVDGTRLALIKRECTAATCPGLDVPEHAADDGTISEGERRERVFEAIYYWSLKNGFDTALNQALLLDYSKSGGLEPRVVEFRPGEAWPPPLTPDQTQKFFEAGVARIVANPDLPPLSSVVAAQVNVPQPTILRTALAFRNPHDAYLLGVQTTEFKLSSLQDEVARIRLTECKVYHGLPDVAAVAKCAGYELDAPTMLNCLNDGPCMPKLLTTADAGALLQSSRRRVSDLHLDAFVPRPYSEAVGSFGAMVDTYKTCAETGDANAAAACLARKSVPPEIAKQANCLMDNTGANRVGCLLPDGASSQALKQLQKCVDRKSKGCAIEAALPPEWACVAGAQSVADLQCLAGKFGGDAGRVTQCLADKPDTQGRILCIGGNNIPESVKKVVACYTSSTTQAEIAVCAIGTTLPPEQAAVVKCAVESGGDPMAAGVCVAASSLKLSSGQQIILQCAASSGGMPITTAACIAGRFTLIELQGCKSAEFGKTGCFGDGNEFQKLAKTITGSTVSKDSVVGQIMVAHIEVANTAISGAGHALNELSKGGQNTIDGFNHSMENLRKDPVQEIVNTPGNIIQEGAKGVQNVFNALNPASWSF